MAARHRLRTGLAVTGLHALDGARHLRDAQQADSVLCRLVAHYSCAIIEAEERGLVDVLGREFEAPPDVLSSALTFCDMTTSPDGELVPVDRRLAEIHHRYDAGHLVSRAIRLATPMILCAVEQVHNRAARTAWVRRPGEEQCLPSFEASSGSPKAPRFIVPGKGHGLLTVQQLPGPAPLPMVFAAGAGDI
jgi:hypothetical protein